METVSKRNRDRAMKIICDYYSDTEPQWPLDTKTLYDLGLSKSIDAEHLASILSAMGYVEMTRYYEGPSTLIPTKEGKCYFERKADKMHEKRVEWVRYIITTAIAVVALIVAVISIILQWR